MVSGMQLCGGGHRTRLQAGALARLAETNHPGPAHCRHSEPQNPDPQGWFCFCAAPYLAQQVADMRLRLHRAIFLLCLCNTIRASDGLVETVKHPIRATGRVIPPPPTIALGAPISICK